MKRFYALSAFLVAYVQGAWAYVTGGYLYRSSHLSYARSAYPTPDSGIVIGGKSFLMKLGYFGNVQWAKYYELDPSVPIPINSVYGTSDGGFILSSNRWVADSMRVDSTDVVLLKVDANGNPEWARQFSWEDANEEDYSVKQLSNGNFVLLGRGRILGGGRYKVILISTYSPGYYAGSWMFQDYNNYDFLPSTVEETSDGGLVIVGTVQTYSRYNDVFVIKLDQYYNVEWARIYGSLIDDFGRSIKQTDDGGFLVAGTTASLGHSDVLVIKLDSSGNIQWAKTYGNITYEEGESIERADDGNYIVAGTITDTSNTRSHFIAFKIDISGNVLWYSTYEPHLNNWGYYTARSIRRTASGTFAMVGGWMFSSDRGVAVFSIDEYGITLCYNYQSPTVNNFPLQTETLSLSFIGGADVYLPSFTAYDLTVIGEMICIMSAFEGNASCSDDLINSGKGYIRVKHPSDFEVRIYTPDGKLVKMAKGKGEISVSLDKGVYFVVFENRIIKKVLVL